MLPMCLLTDVHYAAGTAATSCGADKAFGPGLRSLFLTVIISATPVLHDDFLQIRRRLQKFAQAPLVSDSRYLCR